VERTSTAAAASRAAASSAVSSGAGTAAAAAAAASTPSAAPSAASAPSAAAAAASVAAAPEPSVAAGTERKPTALPLPRSWARETSNRQASRPGYQEMGLGGGIASPPRTRPAGSMAVTSAALFGGG